ncbi:hypothetical protein LZZ90_09605 [Flavobacterium sp. SM15]|uniref:hypothetical protein n=1 Tax=Flavobacterium sp. SM15 TaxID=2908005 RepID=UPI001EDC6F29|nr:hypothetical protein [Flavobacterium sp. SM15]MCG2611760.1 hypothetical protein [Flavobacterium sp. SM15]
MMRFLVLLLVFLSVAVKAQTPAMHCGYDFTSYLVLDVHEEGKKENIKNLRITVVDSLGKDVINVNNIYSWKNSNQPMVFSLNYQIDEKGEKLTTPNPNARWFFPYSKDTYLLSIANTFEADKFSLKVEDLSKKYKTQIVQLFAFNMYVLCATQSEKAVQFGRKTNRPIDIVLEKNK